ncbi:tRNA wybutosine-synthesizing protein 4 [Chanos chanos]|uniref:tRNA wybutosine-synthesizing protein 4 n=1 Tax=Chanos chanos TaxID=29144 RepID=A0A6J2WI48_CHACN|nr:tRNA wybutosine-synthesizing protein 4 [Chanos chanos]
MSPVNRNKKKQGKDTAVQGTNDSSVVSKVSAAAQGYFKDDFLKHFVCKVTRRAPLINRGYYVRWKAVDHCVKQFLVNTKSCIRRQILSLGAGFDSLYFRLHSEGPLEGMVVFEVDFPDVAQRKAALIRGNTALKDALPDWEFPAGEQTGPVYVHSSQYSLLGVDLRQEREAEKVLTAAGLQWDSPTLILSEVVLTYMETKWSDAVISWAARLFPQSMFVMYEQVRPDDPFGRVMQSHFLKLNSALHAIKDYSDTTAQKQRFLDRGWEECVCLDMNQFYFGLVSELERQRIENIEPFDEFEEWHQKCSHYFILTAAKGFLTCQSLIVPPKDSPIPLLRPQWKALPLSVRPMSASVSVEGLGMASCTLSPGFILLSGGSGRGGRDTAARVLIRGPADWSCARVESEMDWGVRLYHTMTVVPGWGVIVLGGRSSPLNPVGSILRVTYSLSDESCLNTLKVSLKEMVCSGIAPKPRWRHTATLLKHGGRHYVFVFGGCTATESELGDAHFLCLEDQHWTEMLIEGAMPEARHSHSACPYGDGLVLCGGLGRRGIPLGDVFLLKPTLLGFCWEKLQVQQPLVPRYSHSAHVLGENLVVVGGVWLQAESVPGVAVINLTTGSITEVSLDITSIAWPFMLHSFCSELLDSEGREVVLIGGGGNCFSFGTHLNPQPVTLDLGPVL